MWRKGCVSACTSPPFRQMTPLGRALRCWRLMFLRTIFIRSGRGITARLTTKSNLPRSSSPRKCSGVQFFSPMALLTSCATRIFLPVPSISLNRHSGKRIASGMPGKPPPVPKSRISVPGLKRMNFAMASECSTWCSYRLSMSLREMTLIFSFQSWYSSSRAASCFRCSSESSLKYFSISSIMRYKGTKNFPYLQIKHRLFAFTRRRCPRFDFSGTGRSWVAA